MRFVGARLRLARAYRGLTLRELAKTVVSSPAAISRFETDEREPTADLVQAFCETLGFQQAFFYRPLLDQFTLKECSFRKKAVTPQKVKHRLLAQGTLLAELVGEVQRLVRFPKPNIPRYGPVRTIADVEAAAAMCRKFWGYGEGPLDNVVRVLENAGVVVVRLHDESDNVDAFSRAGQVPFVILNDAKRSTSRARMDVAHELGHLVMHDGAADEEEEREAQRFAAAFLLPASSFGRHYRSLGGSPSWYSLLDLKRHWRVSLASIIRRAFELGLMPAVEYRRRCKYIMYRGWHKGEPGEPPREDPEVLRSAVEMLINRRATSREDLLGKLGWTPEVFRMVTGLRLEADAGEHVIPLTRARLSLA